MKNKKDKIKKAKKEIKEAQDAVFDAAGSCECDEKEALTRAEVDLEKAEAEVEESEEGC